MTISKIPLIIELSASGLGSADIQKVTGLSISHIKRTINRAIFAGNLKAELISYKGFPKVYSKDMRSAVLDDWFSGLYTIHEIGQRNNCKSHAVKTILERARLDRDPRAISGKGRRAKAMEIRRANSAAPIPKRISLAEQLGIKIGKTVIKISTLAHMEPRQNIITLSAGHIDTYSPLTE